MPSHARGSELPLMNEKRFSNAERSARVLNDHAGKENYLVLFWPFDLIGCLA
jgi:hypothetical protein